MAQRPDSIEVEAYLGGLEYPATKEHIIHKAKLAGADGEALQALQGLPDKTYEKITDVVAALD